MKKAIKSSKSGACNASKQEASDKLNQLIGQIQKQVPKGSALDAKGGGQWTTCIRIYCSP
ncbi:hypothetical protein [Luteimonas aquatica]|uniref:hypothetical protein n=1 Tax=Luteimonas aquatica TaxID=450364 RepID=UPI001F55C7E4|nr:hypothetical protein [Luteimonas aquatica]